ncbi:MAG: hypothetical protein WC373_15285 [Smithella sp.]|jgi:hypothetical protein
MQSEILFNLKNILTKKKIFNMQYTFFPFKKTRIIFTIKIRFKFAAVGFVVEVFCSSSRSSSSEAAR